MFSANLVTEFSVILLTLVLDNLSCFSYAEAGDTELISYAYSPKHLLYLTNFENDLFPIVKDYISKLDNEPDYFFKRYIADYENSSLAAFKHWERTTTAKPFIIHTNPILSHRMIWRFVTDLPKIRKTLLSGDESDLVNTFRKMIHPSFIWPSKKDLQNSMDNLLNIHYIYDLDLTKFTSGIIGNFAMNASLSAIHCFEISKYALRNNKQFNLAVQWLKIANKKRLDVNGDPILDYLEKTSISKLFKEITKKHDAVWAKEPHSVFNRFQFFNKMDSRYILTPRNTLIKRKYKSKGDAKSEVSLNDVTAFSTLCIGGNLQSEKEKSELYCWYESKINSAWFINPQKMELHSKEPYIFQVYDFIGPDLIKYLKNEATPIMQRSMVTCAKADSITEAEDYDYSHERQYSQGRTSMFSWLYEHLYEGRLPSLIRRISDITGLTPSWENKLSTGNAIQIAVYTTGGFFDVHVDYEKYIDVANDDDINIKDRLATFMLYLSDVEVGGSTAFTSAGVAVRPVKGSAVFWYNGKYNGEVDYRTWHGGCPVILGEKWLGTKWIHYNLNMFKRKCTLNKNE